MKRKCRFAGRNPGEEFKLERIPGSKFFDMDKVADASSDLPHMLPIDGVFAAAVDSLGIRKDDTVVVYDRAGIFSAPRVWWTFKAFGHARFALSEEAVCCLQDGLQDGFQEELLASRGGGGGGCHLKNIS